MRKKSKDHLLCFQHNGIHENVNIALTGSRIMVKYCPVKECAY